MKIRLEDWKLKKNIEAKSEATTAAKMSDLKGEIATYTKKITQKKEREEDTLDLENRVTALEALMQEIEREAQDTF